jgi:hypothetical protein
MAVNEVFGKKPAEALGQRAIEDDVESGLGGETARASWTGRSSARLWPIASKCPGTSYTLSKFRRL